MTSDSKRRFEELCDLIVIEHDIGRFSTLVMELNQLDPTHLLPLVSKQPPQSPIVQQ